MSPQWGEVIVSIQNGSERFTTREPLARHFVEKHPNLFEFPSGEIRTQERF
ncbi:hypothetical protein BH23PLA1_BH23PLA1_16080 [soil metagenome]